MAWSGIEPATSRSRVRRANHSATLPLYRCHCLTMWVLLRHALSQPVRMRKVSNVKRGENFETYLASGYLHWHYKSTFSPALKRFQTSY
ncbi:hypothetical protein ElyMa_004708200 [Elysia marginata]|uniref:Uncharacterized protein n=1 Tax=Elysia marginata TaxID=1093978 RepID=A0AAV4IAI3_9GAST|nr:hypothetical protein ElyMa_004708200 [Elysia marginata]